MATLIQRAVLSAGRRDLHSPPASPAGEQRPATAQGLGAPGRQRHPIDTLATPPSPVFGIPNCASPRVLSSAYELSRTSEVREAAASNRRAQRKTPPGRGTCGHRHPRKGQAGRQSSPRVLLPRGPQVQLRRRLADAHRRQWPPRFALWIHCCDETNSATNKAATRRPAGRERPGPRGGAPRRRQGLKQRLGTRRTGVEHRARSLPPLADCPPTRDVRPSATLASRSNNGRARSGARKAADQRWSDARPTRAATHISNAARRRELGSVSLGTGSLRRPQGTLKRRDSPFRRCPPSAPALSRPSSLPPLATAVGRRPPLLLDRACHTANPPPPAQQSLIRCCGPRWLPRPRSAKCAPPGGHLGINGKTRRTGPRLGVCLRSRVPRQTDYEPKPPDPWHQEFR